MMPGLLSVLAVVSTVAHAAETGHIRGTIEDADGLPVPGARVVLSGVRIAGELAVEADADGRFTFINTPIGTHDLQVVLGGFETWSTRVDVRVDQTAFAKVVLVPKGSTEIVVAKVLPVVDTSRSAISTELDFVLLENLPVGRSYQDAVNMLPGVYGRVDTVEGGPGSGNPSVRGEGEYGNNFLIDGISTRDPSTKTFTTNVNFDTIDQIQVYTDGAPAEFGQSTGMTVNVVTKSGGDEHHGSAAYFAHTSASWGSYPILDLETGNVEAVDKRRFLSHELSLTAGGPIREEKLWYFAAIDLGLDDTALEGGAEAPQIARDILGMAKISWFVNPDLVLRAEVNGDYATATNYQDSSVYSPEAQSRYVSWAASTILTAEVRPDARTSFEAKGSFVPSSIDVVPMSGDHEAPSIANVETGQITGNYDSFDLNRRTRAGASAKLTRLFSGGSGEHRGKTGLDFFRLDDARDLTYTGGGAGVTYFSAPGAGLECTGPDYDDCFGYREYIPSSNKKNPDPLSHHSYALGAFLQDDWTTPGDEVTLNLGARTDVEALYQNDGSHVLTSLMPAPRVGVAWNATGDHKTLVSMNFGRYFDLSGNGLAEWADTHSAYGYTEYRYDELAGNYTPYWVQDPSQEPLVYCTDKSIDAFYDTLIDSYGLSPKDAKGEKALAEDVCNGKLRPYHMDKVALGVEREVAPLLAIGARGIFSHTRDLPEDVNLDDTTWVITNPENKVRDYRALELTLEKKWDERWSALVSYTLSESLGHMPGQFELSSGGSFGSDGNNVGVYLDDIADSGVKDSYYQAGYGWVVDGLHGLGTPTDDAGYYGYLPYHSFHQVKLNGFYRLPWGTTLGMVYEFDSGHAWQKRAYVDLYGDFYSFPEGRGSRTMPAVHYLDVRVAHSFELRKERDLELSLDVFNLPDFIAPITFYENDNESFGKPLFRQSPRSARLGVDFHY